MSIDRTEFWTAAGVVVAALVGSGASGYYFGRDSATSEIESLKNTASIQSIVNNMDTSQFLQRISQLDSSIGVKEEMEREIIGLKGTLEKKETKLEQSVAEIKNLEQEVVNSNAEISRLNALIKKDYSKLENIFVERGEATWVIPNEVAISIGNQMSNSAYLTITDTIDEEWVNLGERIPLSYEDGKCSIVPVEFHSHALEVSVVCKVSEE